MTTCDDGVIAADCLRDDRLGELLLLRAHRQQLAADVSHHVHLVPLRREPVDRQLDAADQSAHQVELRRGLKQCVDEVRQRALGHWEGDALRLAREVRVVREEVEEPR